MILRVPRWNWEVLKCKRQVKSWRGHNVQLSGLTQLPGEVRPPRMSGCEWHLGTIKSVNGETEAQRS